MPPGLRFARLKLSIKFVAVTCANAGVAVAKKTSSVSVFFIKGIFIVKQFVNRRIMF